ncbi:MAG: tetratricopeptide repeat protein [Melioribacteraceae bacterium]|nr:tetratricopeptide repeat protein [Melioribacteraceae bacterium]MDD3557840.1 tetratricopeptide repeat protein [Melioribacteraceae bacterium]
MLAKKKKLTKKQIKEDKLVTYYNKALEFFDDFKQQISIAAIAIAVIVVAIIVYNNKVESDNLAATTELSRVMPFYERGNYRQAIDGQPGTNNIGLFKIVDEYGSSEQGEVAKIYLANSYYYLGKIDSALTFYSDFGGSNKMFKATALAGEAACYHNMGEFEKAASKFESAAGIDKFNALNADYLLNAGLSYVEAGQKEDAKTVFEKLGEEYPNSAPGRDIGRYLVMVE